MTPNPQDVLPLVPGRPAAHYLGPAGDHDAADVEHAAAARDAVALAYGFADWPTFAAALDALTDPQSEISLFERAVDAIVAGAEDELARLLQQAPWLTQARSARVHRASLLHYVSANGVENYRQRTPRNIVSIATQLLDAGADVQATCDVYGGGADTLGLAATSVHPREAGVQLELLDCLVQRGAAVVPVMVRDCLANGCPEAAAHLGEQLLAHHEPLTLADLAGIGRDDLLATVLPAADAAMRFDALEYAAWYGRTACLRALFDHGVPVMLVRPHEAKTALHVAAYAGQASVVSLLLARGADPNVTDATWQSTPLVWALHAWLADGKSPAAAYRDIIGQLFDAGATVTPAAMSYNRLEQEPEIRSLLEARANSSNSLHRH
ncbi:ankyrin repeat domain-containing protein [Gemmatimonas sp.]